MRPALYAMVKRYMKIRASATLAVYSMHDAHLRLCSSTEATDVAIGSRILRSACESGSPCTNFSLLCPGVPEVLGRTR